jgi:hypothetical protein
MHPARSHDKHSCPISRLAPVRRTHQNQSTTTTTTTTTPTTTTTATATTHHTKGVLSQRIATARAPTCGPQLPLERRRLLLRRRRRPGRALLGRPETLLSLLQGRLKTLNASL